MPKSKVHIIALAVIAAVMVFNASPALADTVANTGVAVNNTVVRFSAAPEYINGVIMVPAGEFAKAVGGSFKYDDSKMTGTVKLGENELAYRLDDSVARFNGKYIQAAAPMKVINNRFMVPVRFTSEKLGAAVYMNTYRNVLMVFLPEGGKLVYSVMPGDTLWIISQVFGTSIAALRQQNNLSGDLIYPGQKLVIKQFDPLGTPIPAQVTGGATLRSGAGFGFSVVNYLQANTSITVTGKNGDWYRTVTPKGSGYLYYTVVGIKQDLTDSAPDSSYFASEIPVDTSGDYITYSKYTVQKGDYMWMLAEKFGIPDYELASANNLSRTDTLYPGQVLNIPAHVIPTKKITGSGKGEILDWFKEGQYVFPLDKVGKFIDLQTGKSFMAKRTMGANHSDTETLTAADTQAMKDIFGGSWSWGRRPFILEVDGRRLAVSVAGMPHAGVDGVPFLQTVDNRSDNWGTGPNYDSMPGNGMDGHFDVYFLNSLKHVDNKYDPGHQYDVLTAGGLQ